MINHAVEAESAIIGAVLISPDALASLDLSPGDFVTPNAQLVWRAIQDVDMAGPVDLVTVSQHLAEETGGREWLKYLSERMRETPSSANVRAYAGELRKIRQKLTATEACNQALTDIPSKGMDAVDALVRILMELSVTQKNYEYGIKDSLRAAVDLMEATRKGEIHTVPTGLLDLDQMLGGFHPSDLVVIGGRPAMGKTAMLINLALNAGAPAGLISSEQPHQQIGLRALAIGSGVGLGKLRAGKMDDPEWARLPTAIGKYSQSGLLINDRSGISIVEVVRQARKWKHMHGIQALYVDYIQRIKAADQTAKRFEQVGEVVRGLKELARELDIPVVALAQVGRQVEQRSDKRPHMGDMSDSSEIEKEADQVMCLYRDEVYNEHSPDRGILEIIIDKNRHGPTGTVRTLWMGSNQQIRDIARQAI